MLADNERCTNFWKYLSLLFCFINNVLNEQQLQIIVDALI